MRNPLQSSEEIEPYQHHDACGMSGAVIEGPPSHSLVKQFNNECLPALDHRGGDLGETGDGIGTATDMPREFVQHHAESLKGGSELSFPFQTAQGNLFFTKEGALQLKEIQKEINRLASHLNLRVHGYRPTPFNPAQVGANNPEKIPVPYSIYFEPLEEMDLFGYELACYKLQQHIEHRISPKLLRIISLMPDTLIYKGLGNALQFSSMYPDLKETRYKATRISGHRRFSTNTNPDWWLAQPFPYSEQNGEINTIDKNRRTAKLLEKELRKAKKWATVLTQGGSDSADLDRVIQQRYFAFRAFEEFQDDDMALLAALETTIPLAYQSQYADVTKEFRDTINFHRRHMGGGSFFGGPAGIISFIRGSLIGKVDNMALRPVKWVIKDWTDPTTRESKKMLALSSEYGAMPGGYLNGAKQGGILGPGDIIMGSRTEEGNLQVFFRDQCRQLIMGYSKRMVKSQQPDRRKASQIKNLTIINQEHHLALDEAPMKTLHTGFEKLSEHHVFSSMMRGMWHQEHLENLHHMATFGKQRVQAMGTTRPLAALNETPCSLFDYLHQRFAQVTNPPIDPYREGDKFDLTTSIGGRRYNTAEYNKVPIEQIKVRSPIITNDQLLKIRNQDVLECTTIDCTFRKHETREKDFLKQKLIEIGRQAVEQSRQGKRVIILSSREADDNDDLTSLPSILILGAVVKALNEANERQYTSIIIEHADIRQAHDCAALIAMGASAINPYLCEEIISEGSTYTEKITHTEDSLAGTPQYIGQRKKKTTSVEGHEAKENLYTSLSNGLKSIMSKMGINDIDGYRSSGLFEVIGLSKDLTQWMNFTPSRVGGMSTQDFLQDLLERHDFSDIEENSLPSFNKGPDAWKRITKNNEGITQLILKPLRDLRKEWKKVEIEKKIVPLDTAEHILQGFTKLRNAIGFRENAHLFQLRDLIQFKKINAEKLLHTAVLPQDIAMAFEQILPRMKAGHMSFGSLLRWPKEAIEMALNKMGSYGGSGEGGMPHNILKDGRPHAVQVASGRFGVTAEYLAHPSVTEICIKIAQGAKPGEGGQLPRKKVTAEIATNRYCEPNTELISPPPHHDIYSIEDLTQLIHNIKSVNPRAKISVKLVSGTGIGTIAAGVIKTGADIIEMDGYEGGTGAAKDESLHHAGLPFELGIQEIHKTLNKQGQRQEATLRVMGGLKSPLDFLKGIALGADEGSFGTLAMVAVGCNKQDNCNTGCGMQIAFPLKNRSSYVSLQKILNNGSEENYRAFVEEKSKDVELLWFAMALEAAVIVRHLGIKKFDDLIGRADLLEKRPDNELSKEAQKLDISLLLNPAITNPPVSSPEDFRESHKNHPEWRRVAEYDQTKKWKRTGSLQLKGSRDRSFGAYSSGYRIEHGITEEWTIPTHGAAGNSYGWAISKGMHLRHTGSGEEGIGASMSEGSTLSLLRPPSTPFNVCLASNNVGYGATGGKIFIDSTTGQRCGIKMGKKAEIFARGGGEYAAEYMTGGKIILLPDPKLLQNPSYEEKYRYDVVRGRFGSGMSGGTAFVFVNKNQDIHHHIDDSLEVIELNPSNLDELNEFFATLTSFQKLGLSKTELEYWKKHLNNKKGRVVCIRPKKSPSPFTV